MPRLEICNHVLHWQWINWTLLCDTMEVSMVCLASLAIAQHVFQPALTGRPESGPELISQQLSPANGNKGYIAVSRFHEKMFPANCVQRVTAISRKISRSWSPKNWVQHATAIYPIPRYTRPRYIGLTLYHKFLWIMLISILTHAINSKSILISHSKILLRSPMVVEGMVVGDSSEEIKPLNDKYFLLFPNTEVVEILPCGKQVPFLSCILKTTIANVLASQGARASAAMYWPTSSSVSWPQQPKG